MKIAAISTFTLAAMLVNAPCQAANCSAENSMTSVKNFKVGALEYVEFKIKSSASFVTTTAAVTGPFTEEPGDIPVTPIPVNGALFTKIQFHLLSWDCTIPKAFSAKAIIKDVKQVEQFEGYVSYVIGRRSASHYLNTVDVPCDASHCVRVKFGP